MNSTINDNGMFNLTPTQREAVYFDGQACCVVAGAGTGKTHVLVSRIVHLVANRGVAPEKVLAITFTEKAASEMAERVQRQLGAIFPKQNVTTFHSLGFELLREFSSELNLGDSIKAASVQESFSLKQQALERLVHQWDRTKTAAFKDLMTSISFSGQGNLRVRVARLFFSVYDQLRAANGIDNDFYQKVPQATLETAWKQFHETLRTLYDLAGQEKRGDSIQSAITRYFELNENIPESIAEIDRWAVTKHELVSALSGRVAKSLKNARDFSREVGSHLSALFNQRLSQPQYHLLQQFLLEFDQLYRNMKSERGFVDFEDMQELILNKDNVSQAVHREISNRFEEILVDEYQDINRSQKRMVELIGENSNVFFVGDARQSIYSFRYADLSLFSEVLQEVEQGKGRRIALVDNFRSRPEIINFLNEYTQKNEQDLAEGGDIGEPLAATTEFGSTAKPIVETKVIQAEERAQGINAEAQLVASEIKKLVHDYRLAEVSKSGVKVSYQDIAVLFRHRANLEVFRKVLESESIPCHQSASGGFFQTRVVDDAIQMLKLVLKPGCDLTMAAVLRSPFGNLSSATLMKLYDLCGGKFHNLFVSTNWESAELLVESEKKALQQIVSWFTKVSQSPQRFLSHYLLFVAAEGSGYLSRVRSHTDFESVQELANLNKLLEMAAKWDIESDEGSLGFLNFLESMQEYDQQESQAQVEQAGDRVHLMTVHASKGLEFPVVFLADLNRQGQRGYPAVVVDKHGFVGLKVKRGDENLITSAYQSIVDQARQRADAEELRILYVAMSRAKEKLILTANVTGKGTGWLKILGKQLDVTPQQVTDA